MILEIRFNKDDNLAPHVLFQKGRDSWGLDRPAWVQFLALLAYRYIKEVDNGVVDMEEVRCLTCFARKSPAEIGNYLSTSASRMHKLAKTFFNRHLKVNTIGPYFLQISRDEIVTDTERLEEFIRWNYHPTSRLSRDRYGSFKLSTQAMESFQLSSAQNLLSRAISQSSLNDDLSPDMIPVALVNLAVIEYLLHGNTQKAAQLIRQARTRAMRLPISNARTIALAFAAGTEAWMAPVEDYNAKRIIAANQSAIEMAERLPKKSPDRTCLLASRGYHSLYTSYRFGTTLDFERELKSVDDLYRRLEDGNPPKVIPYEPGVRRVIGLQVELLRRLKDGEASKSEDVGFYQECIKDPTISRLNTLSAAEWITHSYLRSGRKDKAAEFVTDELFAHNMLHETALYRRLNAVRLSLRNG